MAELTVQIGRVVVHRFALNRSPFAIGRSKTADIYINDRAVSTQHAQIVTSLEDKKQRYSVIDLNSTNGTFVNGERIESCVLEHDDEIQICSSHFKMVDLDSSEATVVTAPLSDDGHFTRREVQVLRLIAEGQPRKLIARELDLSIHTVSDYIKVIYKKMGVSSRHDAGKMARSLGLLSDSIS